jgi:hypothetical protein
VSHKAGVLAHYESRDSVPTAFIPQVDADLWVQKLAAERISRRVIRLLPPTSVFQAANLNFFPQPHLDTENLSLLLLPPAELPGLRFVLPQEKVNAWLAASHSAEVSLATDYQWG